MSEALILLAAGSSSRMGSPKQLLPYRGRPLLRHAVETALEAGLSPVIVVLGARAEEIQPALAGLDGVEVVVNPDWSQGMGTSIQTGLAALGSRASGAVLALADQPLVTPQTLRRLVDFHRENGHGIVAASYSGTVGVPVFFARSAFPALMALSPDQGCKGVILAHGSSAAHIDCPEAAVDVDTAEDYAALRE